MLSMYVSIKFSKNLELLIARMTLGRIHDTEWKHFEEKSTKECTVETA